jgi:hypothetical protein
MALEETAVTDVGTSAASSAGRCFKKIFNLCFIGSAGFDD